jgi:hypothetical protein
MGARMGAHLNTCSGEHLVIWTPVFLNTCSLDYYLFEQLFIWTLLFVWTDAFTWTLFMEFLETMVFIVSVETIKPMKILVIMIFMVWLRGPCKDKVGEATCQTNFSL